MNQSKSKPAARRPSVRTVDVRDPDDLPPAPPGDAVRGPTRILQLQTRLLDANDRRAAAVRARLGRLGIRAVNLVSSPGAGKTTLLGRKRDSNARQLGLTGFRPAPDRHRAGRRGQPRG